MATRQGVFSGLMVFVSKLPGQVAVSLAVASGLAFHLMSIYLPLSLPPLRLRKPDIVPLALPDDPGSRMVIFPVAKAS
jgi:hypothetical protein